MFNKSFGVVGGSVNWMDHIFCKKHAYKKHNTQIGQNLRNI